jgi:hypothetical protein
VMRCYRKNEDARRFISLLKQRPFAIASRIVGLNCDSCCSEGVASSFCHRRRLPEHRSQSKVWENEKPQKNEEHQ